MSIGTPPHYDSFVFQRRGGGDCAGGIHKLNGRAGERHRRAAEKQKKWRGVFGDYRHGAPDGAWGSARFGRCGCFQATGHTSGRALGGLNNHEKDVGNDKRFSAAPPDHAEPFHFQRFAGQSETPAG